MIPAWLAQVRTAHARGARLCLCTRCRRPILTGLDDDRAARTIHADPAPLTPVGETLALLAGLATFDLAASYSRQELWRRDQWHISGPRKYPVLAEHRCGHDLSAHAEVRPAVARYVIPETPPF